MERKLHSDIDFAYYWVHILLRVVARILGIAVVTIFAIYDHVCLYIHTWGAWSVTTLPKCEYGAAGDTIRMAPCTVFMCCRYGGRTPAEPSTRRFVTVTIHIYSVRSFLLLLNYG